MGDVGVSIAEIIEVRDCRLNDDELLALIIIACEQLAKTPSGVFSPDHVFVHMLGDLEIQVVTPDKVSEEYVPPEIREGNTNPDSGAVHVYCLGEVVRFAGAAESTSADVFSLLNVMTVSHVATRPSIVRLAQMAKNKLNIQNPKALLAEMYVLVMGDEADDVEDLDISSGEYILDALGENGELKETHWAKDEIGSPALSSTKITEIETETEELVIEEISEEKKWLNKSIIEEEDPFENTETDNLATLSGRDPFNSEYIEHSQSESRSSVEQTTDTAAAVVLDNNRKEKQRKLLIDASEMLMGSTIVDDSSKVDMPKEEKDVKKKPLSWPEPSNRHQFDYDDDIVEYKADDLIDEIQHPATINSNSVEVSRNKEDSTMTFESRDRPTLPDLAKIIRVPPIVERPESPTSLSPISEANENLEKSNESTVSDISSSISSPEKVTVPVASPPPRFIKNNDSSKVSQVIPEDEELTTSPRENESGAKKWFDYNAEEDEAKDEKPPSHVDAVVLEKPKPTFVDNAAAAEPSSLPILRRDSEAHTIETEMPSEPKKASKQEESDEGVQHFTRRNSLGPSRISGRKQSLRQGKRKSRAEPEFAMNANAPAVCLKAPAMRKKKMTLHRVEQTGVTVELLNGKHIEVSCRSDAIASEVADVVMRHINFNENSFFGLTTLRDGEHFFLEDNQRLEKFAPAGWKSAHHHTSIKRPYVLYLRFRYYPATVEFIKTDVVLHELYLQLRRDILDDRLQPPKDPLYELAALALQAEYSDRPTPAVVDYFQLDHYLPERAIDLNEERRILNVLSELHGHYSGMKSRDVESQYIMRCQRLPDYGGHFHRVYKTKPSSNLGNTPLGDPQTGFPQWIGILPRGILQYEEHRGLRHTVAEHLWQDTQTLQFDRKRFVIVSEVHEPPQSVFYTDHYTKSAYFVRFAASQHRFMIKMRHWNQTLHSENTMRNMNIPDVGADTDYRSTSRTSNTQEEQSATSTTKKKSQSSVGDPEIDLEKASEMFPKVSAGKRPSEQLNEPPTLDESRPSQEDSKPERSESSSKNVVPRGSSAEEESSECGEGSRFEVTLTKDPKIGLGLTLVDGNLNGIKGVYVKSVTDGGPGHKNGVNVGDRLMSVNDSSLIGKDRHATVDLVKQSGDVVRLSIFRLDAVSTALTSTKKRDENGIRITGLSPTSKTTNAPATTRSRTPPAPRKGGMAKKRQRAVSDFGAVGDALPELNSEDLVANIQEESRLKMQISNRKEARNDFKLPATSMYKFDGVDEMDDHNTLNEYADLETPVDVPYSSNDRGRWSNSNGVVTASFQPSSATDGWVNGNSRVTTNLDWADELDELSDERITDIISVRLERNEHGSLGVQIASSGGAVFIKQITAEPAISNPDIRIGDRLISVNGARLESLTHQQVVELLRNGGDSVVLGLQRTIIDESSPSIEELNEMTITVVLEKSSTGSLGLSLAKKTGFDGIFIRMIGPGSAADIDGTLHVGDRIWQVNGQLVNNYTPGAIVNLLKSANNPVEIIVKRTASK